MLVLAGLGNPGPQYVATRHNAGFMALEALKLDYQFPEPQNFGPAQISRGLLGGRGAVLVWPLTYMNLSGPAVVKVLSFYKTPLDDFLLLHDEMDLAPGLIKLSQGGGHAGHNGVASVVQAVGTAAFARLKIGVGRPGPGSSSESHVLGAFKPGEEEAFGDGLDQAVRAARLWAEKGFTEAQRLFNRRPKPPQNPAGPSEG